MGSARFAISTVSASERGDTLLALVCLVGAAAAGFLLWRDAGIRRPDTLVQGPRVAVLNFAVGDVRRRPSSSLVWERLTLGDVAHEGDAIFVAPAAHAGLQCADGSKLELESNTLIVF